MTEQPADGSEWHSYLNAIPCKVAIATYHLEQLRALLNPPPEPDAGGQPPIAVQAHFEGVLFSVMAAASQAEEAIRLARPGLRNAARHEAFSSISTPGVREWYLCPLTARTYEKCGMPDSTAAMKSLNEDRDGA